MVFFTIFRGKCVLPLKSLPTWLICWWTWQEGSCVLSWRSDHFTNPENKCDGVKNTETLNVFFYFLGRIQPDFPWTVCVSDSSESTWRSSSSAHRSQWSLQKVNVFNIQTCFWAFLINAAVCLFPSAHWSLFRVSEQLTDNTGLASNMQVQYVSRWIISPF